MTDFTKITNDNALEILKALIDSSPAIELVVNRVVENLKQKEEMKCELLQRDQNLAADYEKFNTERMDLEKELLTLKAKAKSLDESIKALNKKCLKISKAREEIHKTWIANFSQQN